MPKRIRFLGALVCALLLAGAARAHAEDAVLSTSGATVRGQVTCKNGAWMAGDQRLASNEFLVVRFTSAAPPLRVASGIFLRGGSMIAGGLDRVVGAKASVNAPVLGGPKDLVKDEVAGAFWPLPPEIPENFPGLGQYPRLLAALAQAQAGGNADGANGSAKALSFGRRDRAVYHNLDEIAGRLVRLGNDMAMIGNATPNRAALRLVELKCEPIAAPSDEEQQFGPEYIVRLRGGDVLRGRVLGLDENALTLRTRFAGDLALSRETLAVLFPAGGDGRGIAWLSAAVPAKSVHTPVFDAQFPARANLSIGGNLIEFNGEPCDRGWGVHSKSELAFALDGKPGKRFVALCGIDDETAGRGAAVAKVLLDGAEAWASPELKPGEAPQFVDVELKAAKTLTLVVDYGPDNDDEADHAGWGWAAIVGK